MKGITWKFLFWVNYILIILYMDWCISVRETEIKNSICFLIASLMLLDLAYISSCNIRENLTMTGFCGLLALNSWYILLAFGENAVENLIFNALSPTIWYVSIKFILLFFFQGSGYKFRRVVNGILLAVCAAALISVPLAGRVYAVLYGLQFLTSWLCFLFIILYHWRRAVFVLKSEWKYILFSVVSISLFFFSYYFATVGVQDHIANFGIYFPMLLFSISVHGIALKEHNDVPLSAIFGKKQIVLLFGAMILILGMISYMTGDSFPELIVKINVLFAFVYFCNIILEQSLKQDKNKIVRESKYSAALRQLQKEEELKTEFANFLHDDLLQDLLSVKNLMTKAYRPDIREMMMETLEKLSDRIREQMHNYHPVILKNLTAKENYQNLIEAVSQSFPRQDIAISFECADDLFLVEPYQVLIYRLMKELLTNVYKHSEGSRAWVILRQKNNMIELCVSDDGTANRSYLTDVDRKKHNGILSIAEQIGSIEGTIDISDNVPCGICIQIRIPMKGDVSYQYFISRRS